MKHDMNLRSDEWEAAATDTPPSPTLLAPRYARRLGFGMAAFFGALLAVGCQRAPQPKKDNVVEVVVTTPVPDEVTDYQDFTGRMDALKTVDIRPRVSGYIMEAPFKEGDLVKEGDLLFQIDPRTYQADFNQAEANVRQAKAEVQLQVKRAERARQLIGQAAIGPEDYEQIIALRDKAIATVGAMEAARERAKLYLDFTHVVAPPLRSDDGRPLLGRISRRQVDPGNLVNADQTVLTTLVSVDPMYAYFDVDERTYLDLAALTSPGASSWFSALEFPVLMRLANEDEFKQKGYVNFLDNRLNANTGTVRMRGVFSNPKGNLKSGLFVRIRLPVGVPYKALLIPDEAILSDQGRKYVYVVKEAKDDAGNNVDKVEYRSVKPGQAIQGMRVIKAGLSKGERVIVTGMQRVRPDSLVRVKTQAPPDVPKSSLTKLLSENRPAADAPKNTPAAPGLKEMPRVPAHESRPSEQGRHRSVDGH
jgi:RND family efflux transporter MFP subunit